MTSSTRGTYILAAILFFSAFPASAGQILSEEISITEKNPMEKDTVQEFLIDSMDVAALSPYAHLLAMPCPMITPAFAEAMHHGRIHTPPEKWNSIIRKAARTHNLPESLIAAVIHTESAFTANAISPKGARGAMQIMPQTQKELGLKDPYDAESNVMAGSAYLRQQLDRFGTLELALAAYNAGPGNVVKYGGIPPFPETIRYVRQVKERQKASGLMP